MQHTANPEMWGKMFSSGTSTSSITICPVSLALRENFPSILGAVNPFIPFSKMKPRILLLSWSDFAHTTKTSAIGELVILQIIFKRNKLKKIITFKKRISKGKFTYEHMHYQNVFSFKEWIRIYTWLNIRHNFKLFRMHNTEYLKNEETGREKVRIVKY